MADTLVEGDLLGHDTHGLALLAGYVKELETGAHGAQTARRDVLSDRPAAVLWDGRRLPGPWLVHQGLDLLLPRARELGTASLVIRRSHHIACLAAYLLRALRRRHAAGAGLLRPEHRQRRALRRHAGGVHAQPAGAGLPAGEAAVMVDISASITTNGMSNRKHQAGETLRRRRG